MSDSTERNNLDMNETYAHQESSVASQHFAERKAEIQAAFLLPHLRPAMSLLDCGCGPGSITLGLAEIVAPGRVIGMDIDDKQVEHAQALAESQRISNVSFEVGDVYNQRFEDNAFDAVFSSAVLSHLDDPLAALTEIHRLLKSGGLLGLRNPDIDGQIIAPEDPLLLQSVELYGKLIEANGGNPHVGKHQRALLRKAGFVQVEASAIYEVYGSVEAARYWGRALAEFSREESYAKQMTELGLGDASELPKISAAWEKWADDPDAFFADAWCEAVGWKA